MRNEVGRLLNQIEAEYLAAQRGLTGFAEGARHAAITARMESLGRLHENLQVIVGEDAIRLIAERLEILSIEERQKRAAPQTSQYRNTERDVLRDLRH